MLVSFGGVVSLASQDRDELGFGVEEAASFADGLELAIECCGAGAVAVSEEPAVVGGVGAQMVQLFGTAYVGNVVKGAGMSYGVFALVLGLIGWIYLGAVGIVVSAEINVVRAERLYPRSLMTPFTDNVDLTAADRHAYDSSAPPALSRGRASDASGVGASRRHRVGAAR